MTEAEWDAITTVHLKGTFVPARHFADYSGRTVTTCFARSDRNRGSDASGRWCGAGAKRRRAT
eukprot:gene163-23720_t